jgi:hypothetical protein
MPPPLTATVVPLAVKLVPVSVTGTLVPCVPEVGLIEVSVGGGGLTTVNPTLLVLPIGVFTLTFLVDNGAVPVSVMFALTVVEFTTVTPVTETPPPDTLTVVVPVVGKLVPVSVTGTVVPRAPDVGEIEASVAPCTVNVTVLLVPPGVVTLTVLAVSAAPAEMVKFTVTEVSFTTWIPATPTPEPETFTAVVPVRLVPVRVTGTTVLRTPVLGLIEVNAGAVGATIVKVTGLLVPFAVVMVTVLADRAADPEMAKFAVTVVELTTLMPLTPTPVPETVIAVAPVRFVPVRVTGTVVPRPPVLGAIEDSVGDNGLSTVNVVVGAPIGVFTVTVLVESVAVAVMLNVAVIVVEFTTVIPLTVTPVPDTVTEVAPPRLVPVRVTGTLLPRTPVLGAIDVRVGPWTLNGTFPVVPPGVLTWTLKFPRVAVFDRMKVAVIEVELTTLTPLMVTPLPPADTVVPVVVKLVPVRVTGTLVPRTPVLGAIEASVGGGG